MNNKNINRTELIAHLIMVKMGAVLFVLIIIIGLFKECFGEKTDPLDNSFLQSQQIINEIIVADSTYNGFRVVYVTKNPVTNKRWEEISSRQHIKDNQKKLMEDAPLHFGNMTETDIYDFAEFAKKYDADPDVEIHNIFIHGYEKIALYEAPNPKIKNYAKKINRISLQGVLYINRNDVYNTRGIYQRTYRYWKCGVLYASSQTDERFIHFSVDDIRE